MVNSLNSLFYDVSHDSKELLSGSATYFIDGKVHRIAIINAYAEHDGAKVTQRELN